MPAQRARRQQQAPIEGFPPATHVTFVGTNADLDGLEVALGQAVEVTIKGTVVMLGLEALAEEETRPVVKIRASTVVVR
jgi:hypothetical protein